MLARALRSERAGGRARRARWSTTGCCALPLVGGAARGARRGCPRAPAGAAPRAGGRRGGDRVPRGHARRRQAGGAALPAGARSPRGACCVPAVEAGAPIVPVAVIGAEEVQPVLWRVERLGRLLGLPAVPDHPGAGPAADQVDDPRGRAARRAGAGARRRGRCARCGPGARAPAGTGERRRAAPAGPVRVSRCASSSPSIRGPPARTVLVLDRRGRVAGRAYQEFTQHFPKPGWVEHDPEEIWRVTLGVLRAGLPPGRRARPRRRGHRDHQPARDDRPVGSRTGRPVHRAIVWQDRRTAEHCDGAARGGRGGPGAAQGGAGARSVLQRHQAALAAGARAPRRRARGARRAVLRHHRLAGWCGSSPAARCTSPTPTNASRTLLYDIHAQRWDDELCRLFDVPRRDAARRCGRRAACSARPRRTCWAAPVPIAGIAGDQQAALFGQGCIAPGMAKNTYGTGCFLLLHTGEQAGGLDARAPHHRRVRRARRPGLRARGRGLHRRRRDPVAARRARAARRRRPSPSACAQRRRARSASTSCRPSSGSGAPVLGRRGARRRARAHPRRHAGAPRARHARVARLPDPRRHGRDGRRRGRARCRRCASTAARRRTTS